MDRVKVTTIPFNLTLLTISILATMTTPVPVSADSGGLDRNCRLNEVKGNPNNPNTFFWCLSDGPVLMNCVSSKIFDATAGKCVTPMEINSVTSPAAEKILSPTIPSPSSPVVIPVASPKAAPVCTKPHNEPEYHPFDGNCGKFWQCSNGVPVEQNCPGGLEFNPVKNVCDWPANAGCNRGTTTTTTTKRPSSVRSVVLQ